MVKIVTEKYSLKGWELKEWARGNKDSLKLVLAAAAGYALWAAELIQDEKLKALSVALGAALVKLGLDSLDFWLKSE